MTREKDKVVSKKDSQNLKVKDMKARVELINKTLPVLVVSIHQNSYQKENIKGAQVFYYTHSKEGERIALIMQEAMKMLGDENTRQAKANDTYYLLRRTKVPTIIVECGFLSNQEEAEKLVTIEYQEQVAEAICKGIEHSVLKTGRRY